MVASEGQCRKGIIMIWGTLFSGGGGVDYGLKQAGHSVAWGVESDPAIAECYHINHPDSLLLNADLRAVNIHALEPVQGLWCSPTCKQHSEARNKSLPPREDASIGLAILPYIEVLQPQLFILENVKGYINHPTFTTIVSTLVGKYKYTVSMKVLNAADYGVPQHRERLILQARKGPIAWPDYASRHISWYEALADMLDDLEPSALAPWQKKHWKAEYNALVPLMVHSQYDYRTENAPHELYIVPSDKPAMTVTASHNGAQKRIVLSDGSVKRMTPRGCARLQTFPDTYQFPASVTKSLEIVGNAVPCLLAQKLTACYIESEVA